MAEEQKPRTKRQFLKATAAVVSSGLLVQGVQGQAAETPGAAAASAPPPLPQGGDPVLRMQAELRRTLQKPAAERRWIMVIDLRKCVG